MTKKNAFVKLFQKENHDESKIYFKKVQSYGFSREMRS